MLVSFDFARYRYYVKSNSMSSIVYTKTGNPCRDLTITTKASIYRVNAQGVTTSVDGNVTLRIGAHDGGSTGDMIGFTVLSSKNSAPVLVDNWAWDSTAKAWRTVQQAVTADGGLAVSIS